MERHEYQTLFEHEGSYWWYRGLHAILLDVFRREGLSREARVLDAGCGTGQNIANLREWITPHTVGIDVSPHAVPYWKQRGLSSVCRASVNQLPFREESFDAVVSVDVLECDAVEERAALRELGRVVRKDGLIVLVVPAYRWLMTKRHHQAVHASRRYTRAGLRALVASQPVAAQRVTYVFTLLFPLLASYRLAVRLREREAESPRSELQPLPGWLNGALTSVMGVERRLLRLWDLPFGMSILAVLRKRR